MNKAHVLVSNLRSVGEVGRRDVVWNYTDLRRSVANIWD